MSNEQKARLDELANVANDYVRLLFNISAFMVEVKHILDGDWDKVMAKDSANKYLDNFKPDIDSSKYDNIFKDLDKN